MQISERNFKRIMKIEDLGQRKAKLQNFCLSIGFHGALWETARRELDALTKQGIKTPLEQKIEQQTRGNARG